MKLCILEVLALLAAASSAACSPGLESAAQESKVATEVQAIGDDAAVVPAEVEDVEDPFFGGPCAPAEADIGEARASLTAQQKQAVCQYICGALAAVECTVVAASCTAGTTFTIGTLVVPCTWAIAATCAAAAGGVVGCISLCTRS